MSGSLIPIVLAFTIAANLVAGIVIVVYAARPLHVGMGIMAIGFSTALAILVLMRWPS